MQEKSNADCTQTDLGLKPVGLCDSRELHLCILENLLSWSNRQHGLTEQKLSGEESERLVVCLCKTARFFIFVSQKTPPPCEHDSYEAKQDEQGPEACLLVR